MLLLLRLLLEVLLLLLLLLLMQQVWAFQEVVALLLGVGVVISDLPLGVLHAVVVHVGRSLHVVALRLQHRNLSRLVATDLLLLLLLLLTNVQMMEAIRLVV